MSARPSPMFWSVPSRPDQAGPLRRSVTAYAGETGLSDRRLGELALAVGEAIANVVVHAYRDAKDDSGTIDVTADVRDGQLFIVVLDHGSGLLPRSDSPGLGLGLGLMSQTCDSLGISEGVDHGTEVHMTFSLPSARTGVARAADPTRTLRARLA